MVDEAAIGIAADQIDVHRFEIGRRIGAARDHAVLEAVDMAGEDRLDAVGIGFAQRLGPLPVGRRLRACRRHRP